MISNGTYLMILAVFLVVIVIFLLAVFFYLRKTVANSKRTNSGNQEVESKERGVNTCPDSVAKANHSVSAGQRLESIPKISVQTHVENEQNGKSKSGEKAALMGVMHQTRNLNAQDSMLECHNCLNCSLIEMGSSCSYSDGSCPQCGRIPS